MEKRVVFRSGWLPWALLAPQMIVIIVFFFWPASQALMQSMQMQDAFGTSTEWVGLDNFRELFADPKYIASFETTALFSILVAFFGLTISLVLAVFADRVVRGAMIYKTLLILPYAVAPAVAAVLWVFMFSPSLGVVAYALAKVGIDWNHLLNSTHAMTLIVMAAVWKQISYNFLFFLAGLQSIPKSLIEAAAIDGAGPMRFFWDVVVPLSRPNIAALFVILFIYGWNQYLWPLLVTTDESMYTTVIGIKRMIAGGDAATEWNLVMATAMLAMLPPALVVLLMQKWFVKGLVETEK